MSTAYGNFIGATLSNRHFQKQGNMSYLLLHSLLHLRTILKHPQQLYHDILHFADNDIQLSVGYGTLESWKRDNSQDPVQIEDSGDYYLIASLLPSNADVCLWICMRKKIKTKPGGTRFGWISRFEAL
ncbi:unnamed protein product [Sphagnum compactum]